MFASGNVHPRGDVYGRGTVESIDPASGESVHPVDPLVRCTGAELGARATVRDRWQTTVTAPMSSLDGDFLFVGDAGTTEASFGSRRVGANAFQITPELTGDLDVSLARARFSTRLYVFAASGRIHSWITTPYAPTRHRWRT